MALIKYITDIEFDCGAISQLARSCEAHGITKPLLVTDAGIRAAGLLDTVLAQLKDLPVAVFDQTPSNPTEAAVRAA
ncbi:MAG: iron-containing alcohol dehydrogenase, partial [Burkholderiaceae bacterium]|nr:iron-containing alcohol dehydrogenase [Burkholderiaceae bacterium]